MRVAQATWLRGLMAELVAGTISGMDGWRYLHETGQAPPEFDELDELSKRGWIDETRPPDADSGPAEEQGPAQVERPRPTVLQHHEPRSQPRHQSRGNPQAAAMRPNHECTPGEHSRDCAAKRSRSSEEV